MVQEDIYNLIVQQLGAENVNKISSILGLPIQTAVMIIGFFLLGVFIWTLTWKGLALWKAAKNNHKIWFVIILIVNTVGILEILYIYWLSKIDWNKNKKVDKINKIEKKRR